MNATPRQLVSVLIVVVVAALTALPTAVRADGLAALGWLAGCWQGDAGEECWLAPRDGLMLGMNRAPGGGFEFLRIVEDDDGTVVYLASPGGRFPPTAFAAVEITGERAVFANPQHDFPQRLTYWLDDDGGLHVRVSAGEGEAEEGFELVWQRFAP